ncbi:MAG: metallo-beta-lactamase family protein [Polyangiaceae bacterium]|jgi:glyoxylase-like metal-dependent hydrolase (beta-lactamase superfamily II)|nr:metallo-beta-lactamase family protein [Polyangiaceae bacterium]
MLVRKIYAYSGVCLAINAVVLAQGCVVTGHPAGEAQWGRSDSSASLEQVIEQPGPVEVETIAAASWQVPLEGMLNLDHPKARAAGLTSSEQPIEIYFHALRHPTRGLFIVDTGVEHALQVAPERAAVRGFVAKLAKLSTLEVKVDLKTWLARQEQPLSGVFFTHLHLDHVLGLPDVPDTTPLFSGPGEARAHGLLNLFTRPITDRAFEGHAALGEWQFQTDPAGRFAGVLDVLGDGSLWALHVPGHSPGSTAYLARTPRGPVLMVGDASHTAWGWEHEVEPGTFSTDVEQSAGSLSALEGLVKRHPSIDVRLGHQPHGQPIVVATP